MSYILCPQCGNCLGDIIKLVEIATNGFYINVEKDMPECKGVHPSKLEFVPDALPPIGFILDICGAKLLCCRGHILGKTSPPIYS